MCSGLFGVMVIESTANDITQVYLGVALKSSFSIDKNEIDDDTLVIETRWCGSRLLYMMWVISMLVTGLAAAYCSIIGYIKVSGLLLLL